MDLFQIEKQQTLPFTNQGIFFYHQNFAHFSKNDDEVVEILGIFTRVLDGRGYESDTGAQGHRGYSGEYMFVWIGAAVEISRKCTNIFQP